MKRGIRIEQVAPILTILTNIDVDQKSASKAGNSDRRCQMVYGGRREDGEPNGRERRLRFRCRSREGPIQRPVKLNRFEIAEPALSKGGECFQTIRRIGRVDGGRQPCAKIGSHRQPSHVGRHLRPLDGRFISRLALSRDDFARSGLQKLQSSSDRNQQVPRLSTSS